MEYTTTLHYQGGKKGKNNKQIMRGVNHGSVNYRLCYGDLLCLCVYFIICPYYFFVVFMFPLLIC